MMAHDIPSPPIPLLIPHPRTNSVCAVHRVRYGHIPKGCRYIVCFRNPEDVFLSFFRFFEGWFFEPGQIDLSEFAR
jgi:hypothetical protein